MYHYKAKKALVKAKAPKAPTGRQGQSILGQDTQESKVTDPNTGKEKTVYLPKTDLSGKPVYVSLPTTSRPLGLYILGMQGMGKSGLMENLIMQDILQGRGVAVLDPHGDLIDHVLARLYPNREKDVIYLDITDEDYPFGQNMFICGNTKSLKKVQEVVDRVLHIFEKLVGVSQDTPLILEYLRNCTHTLIVNPGYTMADIPLLLTNKQFRDKLIANVTDPHVLLFWQDYDNMSPTDQRVERNNILRRVRNFLQPLTFNIVGQSKTTIDFRQVMDENKILLVKLDSLRLPSISSLIGSIIIAFFLNAAPARIKNNLFNLYADEFQNFATEDFAILLEQARKNDIGITMAHQNRAQLELSDTQKDKELKARTLNTGSQVYFRVPTDAYAVARQFDTTPVPTETRQEAVLSITRDPVEWFRQGHGHSNQRVNELVEKYLAPFFKVEQSRGRHLFVSYYDAVNRFLVNAMNSEQLATSVKQQDTFLTLLFEMLLTTNTYIKNMFKLLTWNSAAPNFSEPGYRQLLQAYRGKGLFFQPAVDKYRYAVYHDHLYGLYSSSPTLRRIQAQHQFIDSQDSQVQAALEKYNDLQRSSGWYKEYQYQLRRVRESKLRHAREEFIRFMLGDPVETSEEWAMRLTKNPRPPPPPPLVQKFRQEYFELDQRLIEDDINHPDVDDPHAREAQQYADEYTSSLTAVINEWDELATLLQDEKNKIQIASGQWVEKPVEPSSAEMEARIANKLMELDKYIARVKITDKDGKLVERTIRTFEPDTGWSGKALQDRLARIRNQNIRDGYIRERQKVEDEIGMRQDQWRQPQQTPQPSPKSHRVLLCPKCQAPNQPGAKFCNQCGKPI